MVELELDHGLGEEDFGARKQLVNEAITCLKCLLRSLGLCGLLLEVFHELIDGIEFGNHLREIVVGLGKLALLDGLDGDGHLGLFTFMLAALEGGGEGDNVARVGLAQRGVLAVEHGARTDFVGNVRDGVNLFTVDGGNQVNGGEVAGLCLALDGLEGSKTTTQSVKLSLNVFIGDLNGVNFNDGVLAVLG